MRIHAVGVFCAVATLLAVTGCGQGESDDSPLMALEARKPQPATTTLREVYGDGWDRAVIGCPEGDANALKEKLGFNWGDAADYEKIDEDQQVVILAAGRSVHRAEIVSRSGVDLCGGKRDFPTVVEPGTPIRLTPAEWGDGSGYLAGDY